MEIPREPVNGATGRNQMRDGNELTGKQSFPFMGTKHGLDGYTRPDSVKVHLSRQRLKPGCDNSFS
jgi:hypothetical protein